MHSRRLFFAFRPAASRLLATTRSFDNIAPQICVLPSRNSSTSNLIIKNDADALNIANHKQEAIDTDETNITKRPNSRWHDIADHKKFFDDLARRLGVQKYEDWYRVRLADVIRNGGSSLLGRHYRNSLISALKTVYPDYDWLPWRFPGAPAGFWRDSNSNNNNHRKFFDWAADQLGITGNQPDGWYRITIRDIKQLGGGGLLSQYYGGSLWKALEVVYPEFEWRPWRFSVAPRGIWENPKLHRSFFDWAAKQLNIARPEDWYNVNAAQVCSLGGAKLLSQYYQSSLSKALAAVYPEVEWCPWTFASVPNQYWHDRSNQRLYFDWAARKLNIVRWPEDWYRVTVDDIRKLGGGTGLLSSYYDNSLYKALTAVYPEHEWYPWCFSHVPRRFWADLKNQRWFLDWAAKQLNVRTDQPDDWYRVSADQMQALGCGQLLREYNGAPLAMALMTVYPELDWEPWKFEYTTKTAAGDPALVALVEASHLPRFVESLARELEINHLDEWYRVSSDQIAQLHSGYGTFIRKQGGLYLILKKVYPQHNWDEKRFASSAAQTRKSSQRLLKLKLQQLYPGEEILEEYYHPEIRFDLSSGEPMELDLFIPRLSLAFEYHGEQHFRDLHLFGSQAQYGRRDEEKTALCKRAGIRLVVVPYWWDRTVEGLAELIGKDH